MKKGFAIIYVVLLGSFITAIVIALGFVFTTRIRISTESHFSLRAIYAADTGLEWELFVVRTGNSVTAPVMANGSSFSIDFPDPSTLRSKGRYPGSGSVRIIRRSLEVSDF